MISHRRSSIFLLPLLLVASRSPAAPPGKGEETRWRDVLALGVEGKGWADTKSPFDRLPARAEGIVRPPVWDLSRHSAGMSVRFVTDAPRVSVRWTLTSERLAMPHMPATGVSGIDLYVRRDGRWHFLAVGQPTRRPTNEVVLIRGLEPKDAEYRLYLPLYNGVARVEIGVPEDASFRPVGPADPGIKPVVIYGTSITQGGCASRPGMAYPAILGRRFGVPVVNLGFSGNGKTEPEMARLLAELEPAAFVLDSLPNLTTAEVGERLPGFLEALRARHPEVPILLVENLVYTDAPFVAVRAQRVDGSNALLRKIHAERVAHGDRRITLVPASDLIGSDGEATVDGVHPNDIGFLRMADAIEPYLRKAIESSLIPPRRGSYREDPEETRIR